MEALPEDYDRVPADDPNPEQIYHDSRLGPDLQAALDSLPPEFRAAVVLCDVEGLSYEEIGATLGVKLGTVRSRIHRGRQALRDYLARHGNSDSAGNRPTTGTRPSRPECSQVFGAARRATFESVTFMRCEYAERSWVMVDPGHVFRTGVRLAALSAGVPERSTGRTAAVRLHRASVDRGHRGVRRQ